MTHDYHKPTHTFPSGAYNATQVRLYGIYNTDRITLRTDEISIGDVSIRIGNSGGGDDVDSEAAYVSTETVNVIKFQDRSGQPVFITTFQPVENPGHHHADDDDDDKCKCCKCRKNTVRSIGIIYGYAYEGHCYDLPRPMVMLLPVLPEDPVQPVDPRDPTGGVIPSKDCDYDGRPGYRVWVVDKLDQCDIIDITSGFVEQLVLDANKPGRRSPSTYSAHMQFAHRSGRMPE